MNLGDKRNRSTAQEIKTDRVVKVTRSIVRKIETHRVVQLIQTLFTTELAGVLQVHAPWA